MTHRRTNNVRRKQHGGMKLTREALEYLIDRGVQHNEEFNDFNLIKFLIANTSDVRIVWDASTYSFIFELTFPHGLIDPYGLPLAASAATFAAFTGASAAAAAGAPELGTRVSKICAKISFVHNGHTLSNTYNNVRKETVTSDKANREAETQRGLFEAFACRRTTAPFVPDVIAHAILSGDNFRIIFGPSQTNPGLSSNVASTTPGVLGTPKQIYDWIDEWITSNDTRVQEKLIALEQEQIHWFNPETVQRNLHEFMEQHELKVHVILMEMMDFGRTAPGVPRSAPFQMIY